MKNKIFFLIPILVFGFVNVANATVLYDQNVTLSPGWNIISTPKVLESHSFSSTETSANFDIFVLDASKFGGWATLADLGQTEFMPLYGYFINNKTGSNQILTLNYKSELSPSDKLFERTFSTTGWYSFGIANPTYAQPTDNYSADTNNPDFILNSLLGQYANYDTVIDFTNALYSKNRNSVALSDPWASRVRSITPSNNTEINKLNDFRETKGYAIFIKSAGALYNGFQNSTVPPIADPSTLTISSNSATPVASSVVANQGSNDDQYDQLSLLVFNLQAQNDNVQVTDMTICITKTGAGSANASSTLYLFEGSTLIGTAIANLGNCGTFSNINYTVPKDTIKVLTLKADIRNADSNSATFTASASSADLIAQNSNGDTLTTDHKLGSVIGNGITVRNAGPVITLTSKSITTNGAPQVSGVNNLSTSTLAVTFNMHIIAVGGPVMFGTAASGTPTFASSTSGFKVYVNGAVSPAFTSNAISISWAFPSICVNAGLINSCLLSENSSMDVPVTYQVQGRKTDGSANSAGLYSVGFEGMQYVVAGNVYTANFMSGLTDWRTSDVSFP